MEAGGLCGMIRAGPTDKIFLQRLVGRLGGNQMDILGKDILGRGTVDLRQEAGACLVFKEEQRSQRLGAE